jgi:hypothetical protein
MFRIKLENGTENDRENKKTACGLMKKVPARERGKDAVCVAPFLLQV